MNQQEFISKYESEQPMYEAWGRFIIDLVNSGLEGSLQKGECYDEIVKIKPSYRLKTIESLVTKAFVRKKDKYKNPYDEITDKVGVRFVVLITSQLERLKKIIENHPNIEYSLDRDYEEEKKDEPRLFDYQSLHYVVVPRVEIKYRDVTIIPGTPCEVQFRTLMQHAYAELAHDTIYKNSVRANPEVLRNFAKGMALMETTDDLLCKAKNTLDRANESMKQWADTTKEIFDSHTMSDITYEYDLKNMDYVLNSMSEGLSKTTINDFEDFCKKNEYQFIFNKIIEKSKNFIEFRQPFILLLYFLSKIQRIKTYSSCPLDIKILNLVYSDLGITPPI